MNLIRVSGATALLLHLVVAPPAHAADDRAAVARRVVATTQLAAQEYRLGIAGGKVKSAEEVAEAKLFLSEALRSASLLPAPHAAEITKQITSLSALVARSGEPDSLDAAVRAIGAGLEQSLGIVLDEIPRQAPALAHGAEIYQAQCASCHGLLGRGDGLAAKGLTPPPANLADAHALRSVSPLDFYRRITIGVAGTSMPAFETTLSADDRWAVAAYATLLRLPTARGEVPPALASFPATARLTDSALVAAMGVQGDADGLARVAAVRSTGTAVTGDATALVFDAVRRQLDSAFALAEAGQGEVASSRGFDAYMTFERVEPKLRAKNPALAAELETAFAGFRTRAAGGATEAELTRMRGTLAADLERAERAVADDLSPTNLFVQSLFLMLREGLEALLIVSALLTFLVKTGAAHRRRDIHVGVGAALAASVLTAVALETIFVLTPSKREALEGATMVVAAGVLFYVSYWLLSKMEVVKWTSFVKGKVQDAVTSGSALALASAAFLAVYREGFETVLFYKALFVAGGQGGSVLPVFAGMALGVLLLAGVYIAINRFGVKLPLKPFFGATSAFLYYMAFVFAGKGVAELQEGGLVSTTILPWAPRVPGLGIYPTLESLLAQGVLAALALGALVWTFWIEPRRLRVTQVMVPDVAPAGEAAPANVRAARRDERTAPPSAAIPVFQRDILRSLERMEADLAAMRAEVERMRGYVAEAKPANSPESER
jgi:high-affinity iron transporter